MEYKNHNEYLDDVLKPMSQRVEKRQKPVVHYSDHVLGWPVMVGDRAGVVPVDHPASYLNGRVAYTSTVISIDVNGVDFETQNTKYVYRPNED